MNFKAMHARALITASDGTSSSGLIGAVQVRGRLDRAARLAGRIWRPVGRSA